MDTLHARHITVYPSQITFDNPERRKQSINISDVAGITFINEPITYGYDDMSRLGVKIFSTASETKGLVSGTTYDIAGFRPEFIGNDRNLPDIVDILNRAGFVKVASGRLNPHQPGVDLAYMFNKHHIDKITGNDDTQFTAGGLANYSKDVVFQSSP